MAGGLDFYGIADYRLLDYGFLWWAFYRWPWVFWRWFWTGDFENGTGVDGVRLYFRDARDVFLFKRELIVTELCEFAFVFLVVVEGTFFSCGTGEKGGNEEYGYYFFHLEAIKGFYIFDRRLQVLYHTGF